MRPFLGMLTPLRADNVLALNVEMGVRKRLLHVVLDQVGRHVRQMSVHHRPLVGFQTVCHEVRIHEHVPGRLEDTSGLAQGRHELVDDLDDIAAPHEVEVVVGIGELLHDTPHDLDPLPQTGALDRRPGPLDVHFNRIDAHASRTRRLHEPDQMRGVGSQRPESASPP